MQVRSVRRTGLALAVCVVSIVGQGEESAAVSALPVSGGAVCEAAPVSEASTATRQDVAASRTGTIAGLGSVSAAIGWDNRKALALAGEDFTVTRTFIPLTREVEITIAGKGERPLVIRVGGGQGVRVSRAGRAIDPSNTDAVRGALNGQAIAAFRERIGNYERRLIAGKAPRLDDPHADGFLFVGAFLASLAGDPTAVGRARDLVIQRIRGKMRAVRFDFKDCVTDYERYLLGIDSERTTCLDAANGRSTWYLRAGDRLACEAEFIAGALAGEGQFVSCTALGSLL